MDAVATNASWRLSRQAGRPRWAAALAIAFALSSWTAVAQDSPQGSPPASPKESPTPEAANGEPKSDAVKKGAKKKNKGKSKKPRGSGEQAGSAGDDVAAAFVTFGKHERRPIFAGEVRQIARQLKGGRQAAADFPPELLARVLEESIHRQLVALRLADDGYELPAAEIDATVKTFEEKLAEQGIEVAKYLAANGHTLASLRKQLAWDSAWSKYVRDKIPFEAVTTYFDAHRRDFDGTELRVSHILFRVEAPLGKQAPDGESRRAALEKARRVREEIESKKLTFAEAARRYSDGPSREQGGELGLIPRHGRMVEAFSAAAFALEKDQLSQPVTSPFGIHLILCTEVQPGAKTAEDAKDDILQILARRLYVDLVAETQPMSKVEYADVLPHLDPLTGAVVPAAEPVLPGEPSAHGKTSEPK